MTPFERALRERIEAERAISVEAYMQACNAHYYATRDPLGPGGDFTTAPEISQMFGEIVGAALADCWIRAAAPAAAIYVELGPGRGTLAADALRVMRSAGFRGEAHLVETSPILRDAQKAAVPDGHWHDSIDAVPERPLLLAANEFLDALPIRQHVAGVERKIVVTGGHLAFDRGGEIVETSPVRDGAIQTLATKLVENGGAALLIDYGHERSAPGDTLQAVRSHKFAPVLDNPGEQDLTSHVDFNAVRGAAGAAKVTNLVAQGEWLKRLGISARAEVLSRSRPEIRSAVDRLTAPDKMGALFKVIGLHSPDWPAPAGFA